MNRRTDFRLMAFAALTFAGITGLDSRIAQAQAPAGANPMILNYGWQQIVADPHYPIVGETATISVTVHNNGGVAATNVQVKISYNDWGVTFFGWQQIGAIQTIPSIPAGGSAVASVTNVFQNRAHTCVEAVIVGADENTNPNDDRGQINLEVVSAADTFSYDVPVVNNGDEPLNAVVRGQLLGREQGDPGAPGAHAEVFPPEVQLAPGEMAFVHVELDLRALPPVGPPVVLMIEAVDIANPNNRNNVIFAIRRTTAYRLKTEALAALEGLVPDMPRPAFRNRVSSAAGHVRQSMTPRFWTGQNRLTHNAGAAVFAQEAAAAHILETMMGADIGLPLKKRLDEVIRTLTDADRILAETAIADAGGHPAADEIRQEGDDARQSGEYVGAIRTYAKAWSRSLRP